MEKSTGLLSHFAFALMLVAAASAATVARGDARPAHNQASHQSSAGANTNASGSLPESKTLVQNDNVLPTQNRTQAMALEAENGKLPGGEEDELKRQGLIKQVNAHKT